jgi:hypothetical protein
LVAGNLSVREAGSFECLSASGVEKVSDRWSQKIFHFLENDIFCVCFDVIYSGENNVYDVTLSVNPQQKIFLQKREKR